ncbi:adenylate/guanylate cyclase domain-containing protein [Synechococcus sp. PCC 6717]|uniref:Adenylate/guanylate cyclase domain-containing protein n=1 Tax=Parathermosynechococcus lividus PCC 6715 TaxID=1917166 RepID=A0A2D2Q0L2_PARLV|nr:adenylate/guanylate cyclase domain-containing protein [Thermostichus lividus]ATS18051.1 adenylate/guanylate cyclase domain-containing protein [Thermostichus lividus PCC 6715]MCI3281196.1 adenylate/guanylate cyclase domain-containing protein [Synechococcus sp. PCC 6717]
MDADLAFNLPDQKLLETLTPQQLVAIIFRQQQIIAHLRHAVSQLPHGPELIHPEIPPPTEPHLALVTDETMCYFPLTGGTCWTIGRSEENAIVLADRWMSRTHAMIQRMGQGEFYLIDLGSRNGTFVNGRRVSIPMPLHNGDRITFGQTELDFFNEPLPPLFSDSAILSLPQPEGSATALLHVRRLLTVLVVDIRDFTQLTRQLNEELLSEVIGTWFHRAGEIIRQYGSWVDKYIGDAVMAVWIHESEEIGYREICYTLSALEDLRSMTGELHQQYPLPAPLRIGAGLNTGYAMVGNTGSGDRPDYTALGDTVNAAFRLESATKTIQADIAMGATTYHYLVGGCPAAVPFRPQVLSLKGYETPVPAYIGTFADLHSFLEKALKSSDTLH